MTKYTLKEKNMVRRIVVIYGVGVVGFSIPLTHGAFMLLTPLVLLLSFLLLIWYDSGRQSGGQLKRIVFYTFVFTAGFMVEMWGVNTGALFGSYLYGSGLGPRIAGTPPFIGLSWVLMIYLTSAIFTPMQCNLLDGIVWPSLMMVGYDLVMEHVAPKMDMWSWQEDVIPIQNYLMWGLLAVIFHTIRYMMKVSDRNPMALPLFIVQTLFFLFILLIN
ncbi:MAG: carotenoid biosynthesis protein [Proteiniphilum sp.]|nr:carotenoid biosynthesis protein [Proteiniphilum sp.]